MACCAAAAFFISQIVLAFGSVRRRLFGAPREIERRNDAVVWTLGATTAVQITPRPNRMARTRHLIIAALVAEVVLVAGSAAAWSVYRGPSEVAAERGFWTLALSSLCANGSIDASRARLTNSIEGNSIVGNGGRIE